jgi:hypothetical protein
MFIRIRNLGLQIRIQEANYYLTTRIRIHNISVNPSFSQYLLFLTF